MVNLHVKKVHRKTAKSGDEMSSLRDLRVLERCSTTCEKQSTAAAAADCEKVVKVNQKSKQEPMH